MKEHFIVSEFGTDESGGLSYVALDLETGILERTGFVQIPWLNSVAVSSTGTIAGSLRYFDDSVGEGGTAIIHPGSIRRHCTSGTIPCHVAWDSHGCWLFACNYISGNVFCLNTQNNAEQIIQHIGSGIHPRQDKAHPHHAVVTKDGQWLLVTDLGMNAVVRYRITRESGVDVGSALTIILPDGFGPRHLVLPDDHTAYVVGELSPGIVMLDIAEGCCLCHTPFPSLPSGSTGAAIELSPSHEILAATIRGANKIMLCQIKNRTCYQIKSFDSEGEKPMSLCFSKDGNWLLCANENSGEIVVFSVSDSHLTKVSSLKCKQPMCVRQLPRLKGANK